MKKILVVNDNLHIGGIQKSLQNFLKEENAEYDITLVLFNPEMGEQTLSGVRLLKVSSTYKMLGCTKKELWKNHKCLFFYKGILRYVSKAFNRRVAMKILGLFQKKITGYDVAISYSHPKSYRDLSGGCAEFVLDKVKADMKICYVHCDYTRSGTLSEYNNALYSQFDRIACCSKSVREVFLREVPQCGSKAYVMRNFYDIEIDRLSKTNPYIYDDAYINLVIVARLSKEKGIDRMIKAIHLSERKDVRCYIIGEGPQEVELRSLIQGYNLEQQVFLMGADTNPYKYLHHADYLCVPSYHEAAPMVFDEAKICNIRVLATETLSAYEMLDSHDVIVSNQQDAINKAVCQIQKGKAIANDALSNLTQKEQFALLISN